jgi:hypothetical protein
MYPSIRRHFPETLEWKNTRPGFVIVGAVVVGLVVVAIVPIVTTIISGLFTRETHG